MSRLEELKKKNGGATLEQNNGSSRLESLKKRARESTISSDGSDLSAFINDYESFMKSDYDKKTASDLGSRLTDLRVQYNLNRADLSDKEKELDSYLNKVKYSIISYGNASKASTKYDDLMSTEDFKENSGYVSTKSDKWWSKLKSQYGLGYDDLTYEYINNQDGLRDEINSKYRTFSRDNAFAEDESDYEQKGYDFLTNEEVAIYNYYYSTEGKDKAQEFLDSIGNTLVDRKAGKEFEALEGETLKEIFYGVVTGADQFRQGTENLVDYVTGGEGFTSSTQLVSGKIRDDLSDNGFKILGSSVGQIAYDLVNTTSNMLPSVLVGAATGGLGGAVTLGASATGNAYTEMRRLGYDANQARAYATLVGASEAALSYALGGISKLGGGNGIFQTVASKVVPKLDKAIARVAIELGANMLDEGLEESIQEVLDPIFKMIATGEDFEGIDLENVLYSGLLGALSAGMLEGGPTIANTVSSSINAKKTYGDNIQDLLTKSAEINDDAFVDRAIDKYGKKGTLSGYDINRLVESNENALVSRDKGKMKSAVESRLTELGETGDVSKLADVIVKAQTGEKLTSSERNILVNSKYGRRVSTELNPESIESGEYASKWAESIGTERINTEAYNRGIAKETIAESTKVNSVTENVTKAVMPTESEKTASVTGEMATSKEENTKFVEDIAADNLTRVKGFTNEAATAMIKGYDGSISPSQYTMAFDDAFKMGAKGVPSSKLIGVINSGISERVAYTAYELGRQSAEKGESDLNSLSENGIINTNKSEAKNESGENVHLRNGGKRDGGKNTKRQVSRVESSTRQAESRGKTSRIADSAAARLVNEGREVKVADLGILGGSTEQTVRVVDKANETSAMKEARKRAEARGLKVTFFVGDNLVIKEKDGKWSSVRGYIHGKHVFVRADHSLYTADQIMRHELGHDTIAKGEVDIDAVRKRLEDTVGKENIDAVAEHYANAYAGTGMSADEIWEECICDSLGDMNIFAGEEAIGTFLNEMLPEIKVVASESKSPTQTRGSPEGKASRDFGGYTKKQYNNFGWVRANDVVSEGYWDNFTRNYADAVYNKGFDRITPNGEYMIEVYDQNLEERLQVIDYIVFAKGTIKSPNVTKIIQIYEVDETKLDKYRRNIYDFERRGIQQETGELFELHRKTNFGAYDEESDSREISRYSQRFGTERGRGSSKARRVKEYIFETEENNVNGKASRELDTERVSYAPTFYSHMGKVIDDVKLEKMSSSSILNHLKNRGVKDEEIKWSGIETFLEGKKTVTKGELQEFVDRSQLQIEEEMSDSTKLVLEDGTVYDSVERFKEAAYSLADEQGIDRIRVGFENYDDEAYVALVDDDIDFPLLEAEINDGGARWSQYKLDGGTNYRELVFKMPNASYTNNAMRIHWGQDAEGVLVHARIQDFDVDGKKMLFIEELQSDWHNEGHNKGYVSKLSPSEELKLQKLREEKKRLFEEMRRIAKEDGESDEFDRIYDQEHNIGREIESMVGTDNSIPDAPFRNTYHEYVLKRLLRMAAEEGYDSIGWTTADIQSKRWSDKYAEGYRIEYDHDIPKFLRKYGKKWGATVGKTTLPSLESKATFYDVNRQEEYSSFLEWQNAVERELKAQGATMRNLMYESDDKYWIAFDKVSGIEYDRAEIRKTSESVWSMPITDSMKESVLYEGQPKYSRELDLIDFINENADGEERKPLTNREILANALESTVREDQERSLLENYKDNLQKLDDKQAKLKDVMRKIDEIQYKKSLSILDEKMSVSEFEKRAKAKAKKNGISDDEVKFKLDRSNAKYRAYAVGHGTILEADKTFRSDEEKGQLQELYQEAKEISADISTYDKELLRLEAMKPIKDVLNREKAQVRKREAQRYKEALNEYRESAAKTQRELMDRYQESRKKATEGRNKTAMRHKIKGIVSELNTLLLKPTAKKHIKEELRKEVADALSAINMDTVGADERVAMYNDLIAKEKNPDVIEELTKTRDRIQLQGDNLKEKLNNLQSAYEKIKNTDDIELNLAYQEVIQNSIKAVSEKIGKTSIRNMTLEQLEDVYDLFSMIRKTVRDANKSFKEQKGQTIMQMAEAVNDQVRTVGGQPYKRNAIIAGLQRVGWTFLKPFVAFRTIGSVTLTNMYKELRNGEDTFYGDVSEAQAFIEEQKKKHGYKSWDTKKTKTFTAKSGKTFDLTLEQMMSLYAYYKREQAHDHIIEGGIVFEDSLITEKNKWGVPIKYEVTTKDAFNLSEETFREICDYLEKEHKDAAVFVNEMQAYLSDTMGAKGNEVSMELLGVKLFKEKFYLPIKSSQYYMNFKAEEAGEVKLKSPAFSKETVQHANNPIVIHNFTDLWAEHINDMSMYHSFVLALEDFTRVYNYKTKTDANVETMDTKATLETAYPGVTKYINKFLKDMNGGVRGETVGWVEKLTSLSKKGAVLGSASVTIQQPSAVMRAMAYINPKYFVTSAHKSINLLKHKEDFAELKKYAPIAGIKEMGRFDVGMGQGTVDWIKSDKTVLDKAEDILSMPPAFMDEVTWVTIWNAVKRETVHNNPKLSTSSEEFLKLAGERFTEVVSLSQVYDSVFSRSDIMRNKSWIAKAVTAFMAEPTTTLNMLWDSYVQGKRTGSAKGFVKVTATVGSSIVAATVFNAALKSIITAMRDDDEDESYVEKYLEHLAGELKDNLNPLTLIPVAKDIVSIFQGYDVERMDMALFSDLQQAIDAMGSENKTVYEKWSGLVGAISAFFGVPVKNVERDIRGLITTIFGETEETTIEGMLNAIKEGWIGEEKSNGQQLYEAMLKGDSAQIERIESRFEDQSKIETAIRKALRENDPRIKEAAEARYKGDISGYMKIVKSIIAEGHFKQDDIVAAINSEISAIKKGETPSGEETEEKDEVTSIYSGSDINSAFDNGDYAMAQEIIADLIKTKVANGKTEKEAKSSLRSSMTSYWKPIYKKNPSQAEWSRIRKILYYSGLYGNLNDVDDTLKDWLKD